jgi:circadian clock protein KaiC
VDSFRTVVRRAQTSATELELQGFVQRLALHLTSWQVTSFLVGEYVEGELRDNPVFTVADGLFWLYQSTERNSIVRKLQIMKLRGQESVPGMHTFRITQDGLQTFPRTFGLAQATGRTRGQHRVSTGIPKLDSLMGGGIPDGNSLLVAGPSGSGKSILASQFIAEGIRQGEPGVVAIFEELPADFFDRAAKIGIDFDKPHKDGTLKVIYIRPLDLSVDETVHAIVSAVKEIGAKRVMLDSLVGFEMALAPDFRHEFRESLYRMIGALTRLGVTVVSTVEVEENFTSMGLSNFAISFLADDILRLRYISINGQLRRMMLVVKMRGSEHSIDMTEYKVTGKGLVVGEPLRGYRGLTSGIPGPWSAVSGENDPELREPPTVPRKRKKVGPNEQR